MIKKLERLISPRNLFKVGLLSLVLSTPVFSQDLKTPDKEALKAYLLGKCDSLVQVSAGQLGEFVKQQEKLIDRLLDNQKRIGGPLEEIGVYFDYGSTKISDVGNKYLKTLALYLSYEDPLITNKDIKVHIYGYVDGAELGFSTLSGQRANDVYTVLKNSYNVPNSKIYSIGGMGFKVNPLVDFANHKGKEPWNRRVEFEFSGEPCIKEDIQERLKNVKSQISEIK